MCNLLFRAKKTLPDGLLKKNVLVKYIGPWLKAEYSLLNDSTLGILNVEVNGKTHFFQCNL